MYGPKWPFLLMYMSRDTRRTDFLQVDELSTDPREIGHHSMHTELEVHSPSEDSISTCTLTDLQKHPKKKKI